MYTAQTTIKNDIIPINGFFKGRHAEGVKVEETYFILCHWSAVTLKPVRHFGLGLCAGVLLGQTRFLPRLLQPLQGGREDPDDGASG